MSKAVGEAEKVNKMSLLERRSQKGGRGYDDNLSVFILSE